MADWVVNIVTGDSGQAEVVVDQSGATQGQPLAADQDDLVSWFNQTDEQHLLWQTDSNYDPLNQSGLPGLIKPGASSDAYNCTQPVWGPASWTVYYFCTLHSDNELERGSIQVSALPQGTISIVASGTSASFSPQSTPLASGFLINWTNSTNEEHQPWQTDENYQPLKQSSLADVIEPLASSQVYAFAPTGNPPAVYYYCKLHPNEKTERGVLTLKS